jgi:hypothetical protein
VRPAKVPAKRLCRVVEEGMTDLDDVSKDRLNSLKADQDRANAALDGVKSHIAPSIRTDPALIGHFGRTMRENLMTCREKRRVFSCSASVLVSALTARL